MTSYLFDAAYKPDLDKVVAAGGIAMSVYLTGQYSRTCAQPGELHAKNLGALGNYEEGASELRTCGEVGGVDIGRRAATAAIGEGFPAGAGKGIAFSLDVNTPMSGLPAVGQAFTGIVTGLAGRFVPLVYGEGAAIDYLWNNHKVLGVEWLSASESFPGYNAGDVQVGLVQKVGSPVAGTDEDTITNLEALLPLIWWPVGSPYEKGTDVELDPKDPVVLSLQKGISDLKAEIQSLATIEVWGDKNHPNNLNSIGKDVAALQAAMAQATAAIKAGGVDPNALAQAIVAHVSLAVKP